MQSPRGPTILHVTIQETPLPQAVGLCFKHLETKTSKSTLKKIKEYVFRNHLKILEE